MAILPAKPHFQTQAYAAKVLLIPGRKGIFCTTGILQIHLALIIYIYIYIYMYLLLLLLIIIIIIIIIIYTIYL